MTKTYSNVSFFLLSSAASFCSGHDLIVDGGFTVCKVRSNFNTLNNDGRGDL